MTLNPPVVLSLFAGPGAGKSTLAALTFGLLKSRGFRVELVTEYAKELTWEGRTLALASQTYLTARQVWRQERLRGQVDVIVTDSPILLGLVYGHPGPDSVWPAFLREQWESFDNLVARVVRDEIAHPYQAYGRNQQPETVLGIDQLIIALLERQGLAPLLVSPAQPQQAAYELADYVGRRLTVRWSMRHE